MLDTDSFIVYLKTNDIYKDIAEDFGSRFDKGNNKKAFGLMKDELGRKIVTKFVGLRAKTYSCLIDHVSGDKNCKRHKKSVS